MQCGNTTCGKFEAALFSSRENFILAALLFNVLIRGENTIALVYSFFW